LVASLRDANINRGYHLATNRCIPNGMQVCDLWSQCNSGGLKARPYNGGTIAIAPYGVCHIWLFGVDA